MMKVLLVSFAFCIAQMALAEDGMTRHINGVQARPLHKPEQQHNPMIIPIYTPVQQYPVQQYPLVQPYPVQYIPIQTYPQQHPQYQHYPSPEMHYYPQMYPGVPC